MGKLSIDQDWIVYDGSSREESESRLHVDGLLRATISYGLDVVQPLANHVQTSRLLRKVTMTCLLSHHTPEHIASFVVTCRLLIEAISQNALIEEVILTVHLPALEFRTLLSTTTSIKMLNWNHRKQEFPLRQDSDEVIIAESFGSNRTIENLSFGRGLRASFVSMILVQLQTRPCGLTELSLYRGELATLTYAEDLRRLLHATPGLRSLELEEFSFECDEMETLLDGLLHRRNNTGPSVLISKLSFVFCLFGKSLEALVRFFQTRTTGDDASPVLSQLRTLVVASYPSGGRSSYSVAEGIVNMLAMQPETSDSSGVTKDPLYKETIGSQVSSLSIWLDDDPCEKFFEMMSASSDQVKVACLDLQVISDRIYGGLVTYLAKTLTLRDLSIREKYFRTGALEQLVQGVKDNQSLHRVVFDPYYDGHDIFSKSQLELMHAYCKRNPALPDLLRNRREQDPSAVTSGCSPDGVDATKQEVVSIEYPSLLQTAQTNKRYALMNLSASLLCTGESLHPENIEIKRGDQGGGEHDDQTNKPINNSDLYQTALRRDLEARKMQGNFKVIEIEPSNINLFKAVAMDASILWGCVISAKELRQATSEVQTRHMGDFSGASKQSLDDAGDFNELIVMATLLNHPIHLVCSNMRLPTTISPKAASVLVKTDLDWAKTAKLLAAELRNKCLQKKYSHDTARRLLQYGWERRSNKDSSSIALWWHNRRLTQAGLPPDPSSVNDRANHYDLLRQVDDDRH